MRVHFDGVNFGSRTGPNTFAERLARCLFEAGHEVVDEGPQADVSLVFIEPTGQRLAQKVVQRLDGVWFKPQDFATKNVGIKACYDSAAAVIFQSQFDRRFAERHWGTKLSRAVIGNGIDVAPVKEITIPKLLEMRAAYDKIYVCSSNWHPQKRLKSNVLLFKHLLKQHPNSCLIVLGGQPDHVSASPHVFYSGQVGPEVYLQVYAAADWMLHLAWADHCPNVVVEALSQGTPVACSEVGGTKELVGSYGHVFKEREPYDLELYDYDDPPDLDVMQVDDLPDRRTLDMTTVADLDIRHVAQRYVEVFTSLVEV